MDEGVWGPLTCQDEGVETASEGVIHGVDCGCMF